MAEREKGERWELLLLALLLLGAFGLGGARRRKAGGVDVVVPIVVVGPTCELDGRPIDCAAIPGELAPGSVPRIIATRGSQGTVDELESRLRAAGFSKVIVVSE